MKEFKERDQLDRRLHSGERQVHVKFDDVEQWHRWRYEQAHEIVQPSDCVVDLGCGIGYGSLMLSYKCREVVGVDDSAETIDFAKAYYHAKNISYLCSDIFEIPRPARFHTAVAFEVLEHTPDPKAFFELLERVTLDRFIISAPHESLDASLYPFHYRHFNQEEIAALIQGIGFKVARLGLSPLAGGKTIIAVGVRP